MRSIAARLFRRLAPEGETIPAATWREVCTRLPILQGLDEAALEELRRLSGGFLSRKRIEPVSEQIRIPPALRYALAAQACLPILRLGLSWYRGFASVVIYPREFFPTREYVDEAGVVHVVREEMLGEAWLQGPVILSLADVEAAGRGDGFNLVVHEFAHKLDMQNGAANGMPPLHRDMNRREWTRSFTAAYEDLRARVERGEATDIDPYAATDPAEFFAVLSEHFFETPWLVQRHYPEVYAQLAAFYRQDPAARRRPAQEPPPAADHC